MFEPMRKEYMRSENEVDFRNEVYDQEHVVQEDWLTDLFRKHAELGWTPSIVIHLPHKNQKFDIDVWFLTGNGLGNYCVDDGGFILLEKIEDATLIRLKFL